MGDFPNEAVTPLIISNYTRFSMGLPFRAVAALGAPASFTWPSANLAVYVPFSLPWYYPVRRVFWVNGSTVGGNASIGIYNADGGALYTSASTTTSGASVPQYLTPSADLWLPPGAYYIGVSFSGTTNVAYGTVGVTAILGRLMGLYQEASAVPVPTPTATFASWASVGMPLCGFTRMSSGF